MQHYGWFDVLASRIASAAGHPATFAFAVISIGAWAVLGPAFHFSSGWQLTVNTGTTIVTFLMVFLIQNTQTRDTLALQLKLDELLRATATAHNLLLDAEDLTSADLARIKRRYAQIAMAAREALAEGKPDTDLVDICLDEDEEDDAELRAAAHGQQST